MRIDPSITAPEVLATLVGPATAQPLDIGHGDLRAVRAVLQSHPTVLVCFDYQVRQGSIGTAEARQLIAAVHAASSEGARLVLLIESSGIRVTDSTAGIASLRQVMRTVADARLAGVRMLAMVTRCAFGGASMIACACERRVVHPGSVMSMSGPKLIAQSVGVEAFDASDSAAVLDLLGGAARASVSPDFVLAADLSDYQQALTDWLAQDEPTAPSQTYRPGFGDVLQARVGSSHLEQHHPHTRETPTEQWLHTLCPALLERTALTEQVLLATSPSTPGLRAMVLSAPDGASARDAVAVAQALQQPFPAGVPSPRWLILVDTESHRSHPEDERTVFSEVLAHLALVMRGLHHQGIGVQVVVTQRGGGGILAALGAGASLVSMAPEARLSVLPRAALQSLNKPESAEAGSLSMALAVGAVDEALPPGPHTHHQETGTMPTLTHDRNFYELFAAQVQADPHAVAIEALDGTAYTRGWLDAQSARYAHSLAQLGCQSGDRVAVQIDKSPQGLALFLACVRAGFIFLPLNTAYQPAELEHLLGDARPRVFVCRPGSPTLNTAAPMEVVDFDDQGAGRLADLAANAPEQYDTAACTADTIAALLYTSGTTGKPKGAMLSHRAVSYCALSLRHVWQFQASDVLLHALPMFHAHGLFISSNVALITGARLLFHTRFDADAVIDALPRATVFMGVPTFYHRLLADPRLTPEQCRNMRLFTSGSAPLTATAHREFAERTGHAIVERYGATETMIITSNPVDGERCAGSVGLPLPGVDLRIAGDATASLPAGEIGMIQMRSPGLFSGYWQMPEKTAEEFTADGYFITGDLGLVEPSGYVCITGRAKDLIISGGYNVYPAELETVISEHPQVGECAVVGTPHADFGEAVAAFVIPRDPAAAPTPEALVEWTKARLANYKVPKQVHVVPELPRNAMGKVLKNELRQRLAAG